MFYIPPTLLNKQVHVTVIGAGGTGSYLVSELAQMNFLLKKLGGIGLHVTLYDEAKVSEFNVGRQNFHAMDVDLHKSKVLIERVNNFFGTNWLFKTENFYPSSDNVGDVVLTCADIAKLRYDLGKQYHNSGSCSLWIDGGNGQSDGQVILGWLCNKNKETLMPNIYDLYGEQLLAVDDDDEPSCSHEQSLNRQDFGVNSMIAKVMAQFLWRLLRHGSVDHHGAYIDLSTSLTTPLEFDQEVWASFGWNPPA